MYVLSTGCQWRYVLMDFPSRSTLERIHYALYVKYREHIERKSSPTACVIDSESVKKAEKGGAD